MKAREINEVLRCVMRCSPSAEKNAAIKACNAFKTASAEAVKNQSRIFRFIGESEQEKTAKLKEARNALIKALQNLETLPSTNARKKAILQNAIESLARQNNVNLKSRTYRSAFQPEDGDVTVTERLKEKILRLGGVLKQVKRLSDELVKDNEHNFFLAEPLKEAWKEFNLLRPLANVPSGGLRALANIEGRLQNSLRINQEEYLAFLESLDELNNSISLINLESSDPAIEKFKKYRKTIGIAYRMFNDIAVELRFKEKDENSLDREFPQLVRAQSFSSIAGESSNNSSRLGETAVSSESGAVNYQSSTLGESGMNSDNSSSESTEFESQSQSEAEASSSSSAEDSDSPPFSFHAPATVSLSAGAQPQPAAAPATQPRATITPATPTPASTVTAAQTALINLERIGQVFQCAIISLFNLTDAEKNQFEAIQKKLREGKALDAPDAAWLDLRTPRNINNLKSGDYTFNAPLSAREFSVKKGNDYEIQFKADPTAGVSATVTGSKAQEGAAYAAKMFGEAGVKSVMVNVTMPIQALTQNEQNELKVKYIKAILVEANVVPVLADANSAWETLKLVAQTDPGAAESYVKRIIHQAIVNHVINKDDPFLKQCVSAAGITADACSHLISNANSNRDATALINAIVYGAIVPQSAAASQSAAGGGGAARNLFTNPPQQGQVPAAPATSPASTRRNSI